MEKAALRLQETRQKQEDRQKKKITNLGKTAHGQLDEVLRMIGRHRQTKRAERKRGHGIVFFNREKGRKSLSGSECAA